MASTGFIFAALNAGINPEIKPITIEIVMPSTMLFWLSVNSKPSINKGMIKDNKYTRARPIKPPTKHNKIASNKNSSNKLSLKSTN